MLVQKQADHWVCFLSLRPNWYACGRNSTNGRRKDAFEPLGRRKGELGSELVSCPFGYAKFLKVWYQLLQRIEVHRIVLRQRLINLLRKRLCIMHSSLHPE